MKKAFELFSTVVVTIAAALVLWTQIESRWLRSAPGQQPPQNVDGLTIEADRLRHIQGKGPIALIEFTDYECRFCGKHARETSPLIERQLVETGAIRHVILNFPLEGHAMARKAGEAAECAARQGRYWEMHERLFSEPMALGEDDLTKYAVALGLDRVAFTQCLVGEAAAAITADLAEGRRLGVYSTPTFFVGIVKADGSIQLAKRLSGAKPFGDFKALVEAVATMKRGTD